MSDDIERIRREVSLSEVAGRFGVELERDGREHIACCPFHVEDTPSFTIFTGNDHVERFHCFGCGASGDAIDFVEKIKGVGKREAILILGGGKAGPNVAPRRVEARDVYAGIEPIEPSGEIFAGRKVTIYNPKRADDPDRRWGAFAPSAVYQYRHADGSLLGYVLRRDLPDGGKETPMVMRVRLPDGTECWSRFPFPKPRPLYGLDQLRDGQVFLVEGEKCRDELAALKTWNVAAWAGGTYGVTHTDWTPLAERSVVIWHDCDAPGLNTANTIAAALVGLGCKVKLVGVEKHGDGAGAYAFADWQDGALPPKGWDCADAIKADWTVKELDAFMRATVRAWTPPAPIAANPERQTDDNVRPLPAAPVRELRSTEQEKPATVTKLHTRETYSSDDGWRSLLVCNDKGSVKPSVSKNWALFIENMPETAGLFAYDAFKQRISLMRCPPWEGGNDDGWHPRSLTDRDYSEVVMWLESYHLTPKASTIQPVILAIAERNRFDRLREYLDGLEWDGKARVANWLAVYLGTADTPYMTTIGKNWLVSSVARGLEPGCKVDTMPILEGLQGLRKSAVVKALYGSGFTSDSISEIGSKDAIMEMQGVWGLEVAEMHRMTNAEVNKVKQFLTTQEDNYRPPYGRNVISAPRRTVLIGTINPDGNPYLRDPTGARRFWPIECGRIDIEAIKRDRNQLWAEAVAMFRNGVLWWVQPDEMQIVEAEQEKRTDVDTWVDIIAPFLKTRLEVSQLELFKELSIPPKDQDKRQADRIGRIMKKLGWTARRNVAAGEVRTMFLHPTHGEIASDDEAPEW